MSAPKHQVVSAQVAVARAAGPKAAAPDPRDAFQAAGFEVGPLVGGSFSITGPAPLVEKFFHVKLAPGKGGGVEAVHPDGSTGEALPTAALPAAVRKKVAGVTFTRPPDFGPTAY